MSKQSTKITRALFLGPKSYVLEYPDGRLVTKLRGHNRESLSYTTLEHLFYNGGTAAQVNLDQIISAEFKLFKKNIYRAGRDLTCYDKRTFSADKKKTHPLWHINGLYTTGI